MNGNRAPSAAGDREREKALEILRESLSSMRYEFCDRDMKPEVEGSIRMKHGSFPKLVEDMGCLYPFEAKNSVCIADKGIMQGGSVDQFKKITEKRAARVDAL